MDRIKVKGQMSHTPDVFHFPPQAVDKLHDGTRVRKTEITGFFSGQQEFDSAAN